MSETKEKDPYDIIAEQLIEVVEGEKLDLPTAIKRIRTIARDALSQSIVLMEAEAEDLRHRRLEAESRLRDLDKA